VGTGRGQLCNNIANLLSDIGLVNALYSHCLRHLDSLCKGGKSNPSISKIKYSVVVGHEDSAHGPDIGYLDCGDTAKAIGGTHHPLAKVESVCYGEGNASKVENNVRENGVARKNVVSIRNRQSTRDMFVEVTNNIRMASDEVETL
jgi:hypothetical protein